MPVFRLSNSYSTNERTDLLLMTCMVIVVKSVYSKSGELHTYRKYCIEKNQLYCVN